MQVLEFARVYDYSREDESVVLPVVLRAGLNEVRVAASVDTGASFCMFGAEIADALGLDLTNGIRRRFRTANSVFDAYGHGVELHVLGLATHSLIYFFADPMIDRNVLGRTGWLDRVRLGLIHHDNKIYLAPYDPA
jgi:Aspartyl protease